MLDGLDISPAYEIERYPREQSVARNGCPCSESWIPPGRSVVFKVPRAALTDIARLRVHFRYEWEHDDEPEPRHYVFFHDTDLRRSEQ